MMINTLHKLLAIIDFIPSLVLHHHQLNRDDSLGKKISSLRYQLAAAEFEQGLIDLNFQRIESVSMLNTYIQYVADCISYQVTESVIDLEKREETWNILFAAIHYYFQKNNPNEIH